MTLIEFDKYEGLGNDFILIDNLHDIKPILSPEQAVTICKRNYGIGADGVIFALPGKNECNYTMRIYNSDGSEPQMCGNGIRCLAKFLQKLEGAKGETVTYKIWTNAGLITPTINISTGLVTVDMGCPILEPCDRIPTTISPTVGNKVVDALLECNGTNYKTTAVSMGNPHSVGI